jgi:hypothetical protein
MSGTTIDRDRQAVYDLEDVAFAGTVYAQPVPFDDAARLLGDFCTGSWWADRGLPHPTVLPTRSDSMRSYASTSVTEASVHLSPDGCAVTVIAHELAHVLAARLAGDTEAMHGPTFRRADVVLVGALMGAAAADRLAELFVAAGLVPGPELHAIPPPPMLGFWASWRAARIRAAAIRPSTRGPIAL